MHDGVADPPPETSAELPEPIGRVEEQLIVLLRRSRQLWRETAAAVHPELQPIGYRLLTTLVKDGPANPGRLADHLETDKSVVSRQARGLEAMGLLVIEPDPTDGRGRLLRATPRACHLVAETRRRALAQLSASLGGLADDEIDHLAQLLERVNLGLARET